MEFQKKTFASRDGRQLKGYQVSPKHREPETHALFAHCFAGEKNFPAIGNICRPLLAAGFGIFILDFTDLSDEGGNYAASPRDIVAAARYLGTHQMVPSLCLGHSLAGAALLLAAGEIPSLRALALLGVPGEISHVKRLLHGQWNEEGEAARAVLEGSIFSVQKAFLDLIAADGLTDAIHRLRLPLLILHAPEDTTVEIANAEMLLNAATHPKNLVALQGADHLLSNERDSDFAGQQIAGWSRHLLSDPDKRSDSPNAVVASLHAEDGFYVSMQAGGHFLGADEPVDHGGRDKGPSPYQLLSSGLAACTAMTLQIYAKRKGWPLEHVEVHTAYDKTHAEDCEDCESPGAKIDTFNRSVKLSGQLSEEQARRLLEIADKCPVHKTLVSPTQVITKRVH